MNETLARELACPGQRQPVWSDWEWTLARAVATTQGVSALLCCRSGWQGGAGWAAFLEAQRWHVERRHRRIDSTLVQLHELARGAGLSMVALKGAELHAIGIYVPGERPMADIDLLVRPADIPAATALIESLGYAGCEESWKERLFVPLSGSTSNALGENADNPIKIELHRHLIERLPWQFTSLPTDVMPARSSPGLNNYSSTSALMLHLLLHAAGAMPARGLRLIQLHDIAELARRMSAADWSEIIEVQKTASLWWAFPPLHLTARYYPSRIPPDVLNVFERACPRRLRSMARRNSFFDYSHSYLWVEAFPGIRWCRSLPQMIEYAANRIHPSTAQRIKRQRLAASEQWAQRGDWTRRSQASRVLRWLTSRPVRPSALHAIQTAFQPPISDYVD